MDHVTALRRKVEDLRAEIARIRIVNAHDRREMGRDATAQASYVQRLSRLEEIKEELARLLAFGRTNASGSDPDENERHGRPFLVRKAS